MKQLVLCVCILLLVCSTFAQSKKVVKLKVNPKVEETDQILVYPNPTTDIVYVNLSSKADGLIIMLFDSEGKLLFKNKVNQEKDDSSLYQFSLSEYPQGNYFVTVLTENKTNTYSIIKN